MLGAAGIIAPEILASAGVIPQSPEEVLWYKSGLIPPLGVYDKYWTDPWSLFFIEVRLFSNHVGRVPGAHIAVGCGLSLAACATWQVIAVQFAELKRWQDYRYPGSQGKQYFLGLEAVLGGSGEPAYPGACLFWSGSGSTGAMLVTET